MSNTAPSIPPSQPADQSSTATETSLPVPSSSAAPQQPLGGSISGGSPLQGNPTQDSSPNGLSHAGKIGLGVGIGAGFIVIAAIVAILFFLLRRRRERRMGPYGAIEHGLEKDASQVSHATKSESMPAGESPYAPVPEVRTIPRRGPLDDVPYIAPPVPRNRRGVQTPPHPPPRMAATITRPPTGPDASPSTFAEVPPTRHSVIDTMKPMPNIPPAAGLDRQPSPVSPMSPVSPLESRSSASIPR